MNTRRSGLLALACFAVLVFSMASASQSAQLEDPLVSGMSPFEDLIEVALDGNDSGISSALGDADRQSVRIREALPDPAAKQLAGLMQELHRAAAAGAHLRVASDAVEAFRLLVDNVQVEAHSLPREVSLLDYAGFKLRVLAAAEKPSWKDIRETVDDADAWWRALHGRVSERSLRDAFDSTIRGLRDASRIEDVPMLRFAAQIDLDLVDLLEVDLERSR